MRADARRRREALLNAAVECFSRSGYAAPLEEIAERAGVGRGTLYRNFPDRMALVLAIFERELAGFEDRLAREAPLEETIVAAVLSGAKASSLFMRLAADMPLEGPNLAAFEALGESYGRMLTPVLDRAKARGEIRADASIADLRLAIGMVTGTLYPHFTQAQMRERVTAAIRLVMCGLAPATVQACAPLA